MVTTQSITQEMMAITNVFAVHCFFELRTDLDAAVRQAVGVEDGGDGQVRMKIVGVAEEGECWQIRRQLKPMLRDSLHLNAGKNALAKIEASRDISMVGKVNGDEEGVDRVLLKTRGAKLTDKADQQNGIGHFSQFQTNCKVLWGDYREQRWAKSAGLEEIIGLCKRQGMCATQPSGQCVPR